MAQKDTPTTNLGLRKQGRSNNEGDWGSLLNAALDKLDLAFGILRIPVTGGVRILSRFDYIPDEVTASIIKFYGTLVEDQEIVFPQMDRDFTIVNATTGNFTLKVTTGIGTARKVEQGGAVRILIDGTGISIISPTVSLGGESIGDQAFAILSISDKATIQDIEVNGDAQFDGPVDINAPATFTEATGDKLTATAIKGTTAEFTGAASAASLAVAGNAALASGTVIKAPTGPSDIVPKSYVDTIASGLQWKQDVKLATIANITLSGTQNVDGGAAAAGDRVLVKNQTNSIENGIWLVSTGAWTRATDADTDAEIQGMVVFVTGGVNNAGKTFLLTTSPATIAGAKSYSTFSVPGTNVEWKTESW